MWIRSSRNLQGALPEMISQLRAAPEDLPATFKLYRNLDALYDVMGGVVEGAGAFGSKDDMQSLSNDLKSFEGTRKQLAERIESLSSAKEAEIVRLRADLKTAQAATAEPPKKIVVDDTEPPKKPAAKKKPKRATPACKRQGQPAATPAPQAPREAAVESSDILPASRCEGQGQSSTARHVSRGDLLAGLHPLLHANLIIFPAHLRIAALRMDSLQRMHMRPRCRGGVWRCHPVGGAAGCVRDGGAAAAGAAQFQADRVVLPAHVDSMARDRRTHQEDFAAAEFPGILRAAVVDIAAGILGGGIDFWIRSDPIRNRRTRATQRRTAHVRQNHLSQRRDVFYAGIWRYRADIGRGAGAVGI